MSNKKLIEDFSKLVDKQDEFHFKTNHSTFLQKVLPQFYKELKAIKISKLTKKKVPFQKTSLMNGAFISQQAKSKINKYKQCYLYQFKVNQVDIHLSFVIFNNISARKYNESAEKVSRLLHFLFAYSNTHMTELTINIVLGDDKKKLSNKYEIIEPKHVNTAITYACAKEGEIFLYRKEEWFKVLIHELMHSTCMDFSGMNTRILKNNFKKIFNIKSEYEISESYAEFWATILNCVFLSYDVSKDLKSFKRYLQIMLHYERIFSLYQSIKLLKYMKINGYLGFISGESNLYEEKTNAFAYFIVKTILLHNYDTFIHKCYNHNTPGNPIEFYKSPKGLDMFFKYFLEMYKENNLLKHFEIAEKMYSSVKKGTLKSTMRMTLFEKN